jgi:hypothetical protein
LRFLNANAFGNVQELLRISTRLGLQPLPIVRLVLLTVDVVEVLIRYLRHVGMVLVLAKYPRRDSSSIAGHLVCDLVLEFQDFVLTA